MKTLALWLIGPGLLVLTPIVLVVRLRFRSRAVPASGTVVACEERTQVGDRSTVTRYDLTIGFSARDGREHTLRVPRHPIRHPVGAAVAVLYDPADPGKAELREHPIAPWVLALGMLVIGAAGTFALLRS